MRPASLALFVSGALALAACGGKSNSDGNSGDGSTGSTGISTVSGSASATTTMTTTTDGTTTATTATTAETTSVDTGTTTGTDSATTGGSSTTSTNDPGNPLDCGGKIYQCGDMMDNDMDGTVDLMDPECTGPCDDDEGSFQTGLPGDNMDCKQDCFFDGNSGQGDDGCIWDLKCDPENPGANVGCAYDGGNNCDNQPPNQSEGCIMFCEQFVPPGCDCFGCCTVQTPDGPVDIYLDGSPDCSLDNLDACTHCVSQIDNCGNPCVPEDCEICFGETEPPEGCGDNMCDGDLPCTDTPDCPTDYFCYLDCCYPPPPG